VRAFLELTAEKFARRRFTDATHSAFGPNGVGCVGSARWREVNDQERADQLFDEAAERRESGE